MVRRVLHNFYNADMNFRAIARDEKRYPDACLFKPERFIDADGSLTDDDPKDYIFGRGRRACPGGSSHSNVT
jgi:cytochrome P450